MERQKPVADRIRPFLAAMERSIDSARRKRCNEDEPPHQPEDKSNNGSPESNNTDTDMTRPSGGDDSPPRLKARPKRPMNLNNNTGGWRSAS